MNLRPASHRIKAYLCTCLWLTLGMLTRLSARAGGAGGHSSGGHSSSHGSSHGSSSFGGSSYHGSGGSSSGGGFGFGGFICFFLFLVIVIVLVVIFYNQKSSPSAPLASDTSEPDVDSNSLAKFLATHPEFDVPSFNGKVRGAFLKIQAAWSAQNISPIRPFISDGMYQRFATQFRMMELLKQQNQLDQIQIIRVEPVSARTDGEFDVIDVYVEASMHDAFVCELDHSLDTEGDDAFVEYWSFIRKRDAAKSTCDIFDNTNCPSCGAALPKDMGELCRCSYCQVMVNSGEFDWVLAEITQAEDYGNNSQMAPFVSPDLAGSIAAIAPECPDFSTQIAEDKASNAFMQIMTALATRNPASVRRFVSDDVFAKVSAMITDKNIIFDRIYLNESVLLRAARAGTKHELAIGLSASMQRVELLPDHRLAPIDTEEIRSGHVLIMERDADAVPEKGSLYQHQCANCGGAVGDTVDINCQYCGSPLNSTRNEWIVTGFVTTAEYAGKTP
jgi:predicted lipid-binding transport protein (Tim44 family)